MKGKVKKKTSRHSKKVTRVPSARKGVSKGSRKTQQRPPPKSSKKHRGKKSQSQRNPAKKKTSRRLVTVTRRNVKETRSKREIQLEKEVQQLRRQLSETKRSEAAKKGWATRRAKVAQKQADSIQEVVEARIAAELSPEDVERQQHLREPHVQRQIQQRLVEKMPEFFTRDEHFFERVEPQIMLRLIIAEQEGDLHETILALADEYDYDSHSIYELWNGYELDS